MPSETGGAIDDQAIAAAAYTSLNAAWAKSGSEALAAAYPLPFFRAELLGLDHTEVARILARVKTFWSNGENEDWVATWSSAGSEYEQLADVAIARGRTQTAAAMGLASTACFFVAAYIIHGFAEMPARERAHARSIEAYRRVAALFSPPAEDLRVRVDDVDVAGYLRVPVDADRPPCVILVGGANSTKEDNHGMSEVLLRRGLATFTFDGPGQGEFLQKTGKPMRVKEFVRAIEKIIDTLTTDARLDSSGVGVWGKASGSVAAVHAAVADSRVRALALLPATYEWAEFVDRFPVLPQKLEMAQYLGARNFTELKELIRSEMSVADVAPDLRCPVHAVNSELDIIPWEQGERLRSVAAARVELEVLPGRVHGGPPTRAFPLQADWLRDQLGARQIG